MLTRWNDWGLRDVERTLAEFDGLRREMNRLFEGQEGQRRAFGGLTAAWPRVGLYDQGAALVLVAELPGIAKENIDISLDQGVLTLKGERRPDAPEGYSVHRQERGHLKFARSFTLPCLVDAEKTTANLKNGVLTLTLPKAPEAQPRQITVTTK